MNKMLLLSCPPLRLGFQKLFDVFYTMLCGNSDDVVQGVHLTQHLHNLLDLLPVGRYSMCYSTDSGALKHT